jgi:hypothetical protein
MFPQHALSYIWFMTAVTELLSHHHRHYNLNCLFAFVARMFVWPPLWSSAHSFWLQIQMSWFDSRRYQIFWEVVGLEQGPLSLVSTIEELLGRKSSASGLESRQYVRRDPSRWPRGTPYPQTLALTSPTNDVRSVGIVCSWTQTTEFLYVCVCGGCISSLILACFDFRASAYYYYKQSNWIIIIHFGFDCNSVFLASEMGPHSPGIPDSFCDAV